MDAEDPLGGRALDSQTTSSSPSERELVALTTPPENRPRAPSQPCEACGSLLDPLRAPRVLAFEDGYRFLCGPECEHDYRQGARQRRAPTPAQQSAVTALYTPKTGSSRVVPLAISPAAVQPGAALWLGVGGVVGAMVLGIAAQAPGPALASAVCSCVAAFAALHATLPVIPAAGRLSWGLGPLGAALAAVAAERAVVNGTGSWLGIEGAALAAAAVLARAFIDRASQQPLDAAAYALVCKLPARVHVPIASASDPLAMSMQLVEAAGIRTGEAIVAMRGETLAVDGIVQAGEASVLPYPGATTPIKRAIGDPVLAGASVVNGALRVLATRVGDERSVLRLARLGSAVDRDPALLSRLSQIVVRWGGLFVLGIALVMLAQSAPWAAASAVLLSAPLLSLRRAASSPFRAAAAMAGARGIVYSSASALDAVGRAHVAVLSPHGMLTESRPVVVELHPLDDTDADALIAMAAAAERAAAEHPIARAVERLAQERHLPELEVRRPVYHAGKGVTAISPQGQPLVIGSRRLLLEEGISVAVADAEAARAEASERTPIFVALDGRVRAVMTLHYELRTGARSAVQRLFDLGLEVVLLTGDQRGAVQALAAALDIEHVKAELLPEERGQEVRSLRDTGGSIAVLGHPGQDDPALAAADAGIMLGAAGGAAAERAVALVSDDLRDAAAALWIARAARESAWRAMGVSAIAFALIVAAAGAGLIVPGVAALLSAGVDAYCLPAGSRLLRRIALRLPARS
jgi:Cu+-exporting ATPase